MSSYQFYQGQFISKLFPYLFILFTAFILASCSGGEDEESAMKRAKDSTAVYVHLDEAFTLYKSALEYNDSENDRMARDKFEDALKRLKTINIDILEAPGYFPWRKDHDELATSIVQDYISTQQDISSSSLVFDYAKRLEIKYNKEEIKEVTGQYDRESLPDGSTLELVRNSVVDEFIEFWTNTERGRNFIDKTVYRSGKFFPLMRKILRYYGAPEELIYLSVQESGLNPTIVSRAGAVGLWQFMPATGMAYGLYQDGYRDDRRDFEKATDAAARHLLDLYRTYGDWYLSFAAYNAGPGRVNSAIRKGGVKDFWAIRGYLPGETKNYVPYILALSYVFRNLEEFGFTNVEYGDPISFERVNIKTSTTLHRIAELCNSDVETLRELNPELISDDVPLYDAAYQIRIPLGTYEIFAQNYQNATDLEKNGYDIPEFAGSEVFGKVEKIVGYAYNVEGYKPMDPDNIITTIGKKKVMHTFGNKDKLNVVAINYSVRPTDIRIWNNITYGRTPLKNQQLLIYVEDESYTPPEGNNDVKEKDNSLVGTDTKTEDTNIDTKDNSTSETTSEKREFFGQKVKGTTNNNTNTKNNNTTTKTPEIKTPDITTKKKETNTQTETKKETVKDTKKETTKKKTNTNPKQVYTVKEGDYLGVIADAFGVSVQEIKDWNSLESDVIIVNQKLTIYSSNEVDNVSNKNSLVTHTVAEGENLTLIASKYGTTVSGIMEKNELETDVIFVGQKLIISGNTSTGNKKTIKKKTYTVKSGDNLTNIAKENGLTLKQLMDLNNLSDDNIKIGQVLKLN